MSGFFRCCLFCQRRKPLQATPKNTPAVWLILSEMLRKQDFRFTPAGLPVAGSRIPDKPHVKEKVPSYTLGDDRNGFRL